MKTRIKVMTTKAGTTAYVPQYHSWLGWRLLATDDHHGVPQKFFHSEEDARQAIKREVRHREFVQSFENQRKLVKTEGYIDVP